MASIVTGDLYEQLDGKLFEIKRQIRQAGGYPFSPSLLNLALQALVEGRFPDGLGGLIPRDPVTLGPLVGTFDPDGFFSNGNTEVNLYVWDDFKSCVLSSASPVTNRPALGVSVHDLAKNMYDSEIRAELPTAHVFSWADLWVIGALVKLQPRGEEGTLLNNGYANIFYLQVGVQVFVVRVYWHRDHAKWYVNAWKLVEYGRWSEGPRVLSRN